MLAGVALPPNAIAFPCPLPPPPDPEPGAPALTPDVLAGMLVVLPTLPVYLYPNVLEYLFLCGTGTPWRSLSPVDGTGEATRPLMLTFVFVLVLVLLSLLNVWWGWYDPAPLLLLPLVPGRRSPRLLGEKVRSLYPGGDG